MQVGINGGAGAGKSRVLDWLREHHHACIIRTDDVAKALMEPGKEGYERVVRAFGTWLLEEDGRINRPALARRIFSDQEAKETVNRLTHPLVWAETKEEIERAREAGFRLIAVESALFDGSALEFLDEIWLVDAPDEVRIQRMMESRGYSRHRCEAMLASQPDRETYRALTSRIFDNGGSWEETQEELEKIFCDFQLNPRGF